MTTETAVPAPSVSEAPKGISNCALKWIAVVTMVLDHIGASILERGILAVRFSDAWFYADMVLRIGFGRLAFPIFCFLLGEGFRRTHDRRGYALRLGAFCLASEIPFDLAFSGMLVDWQVQNVFFTLEIGFLALWAMEAALSRASWSNWGRRLAAAGALLACASLAQALRTDYGAFGVVLIALFHLLRGRREWQRNLACGLACAGELTAPLALVPIHFYNGERGRPMKFFFYWFYLVHLLALALITYLAFGV